MATMMRRIIEGERLNRAILTITAVATLMLAMLDTPALAGQLDGSLIQLLNSRDLRSTRYSICVIDADTGEVLADINADEPLIPASNMKLLTTASAMDVLGKDFVFRTELSVTDPVATGAKPDLMIRGDGDPALGDPVLLKESKLTAEDLLDEWVQAVKRTGGTSFGRLIINDRVFDQQRVHPSWPVGQLHKHYCAQVAGLNFHNNCLHALPSPSSRAGAGPQVTFYPESPFLQTINSATSGGANEFWVDRKIGTNQMTFRGRVKTRFYTPVRVTLHDPPIYLAQLLLHRLGVAGIKVDKITRLSGGDDTPTARPIHRVETLMPAVLRRTNQDSQNLFAEALLKRMGHALTGSPGNWENGAAAIRHALSNRIGTLATGATIADGSGLSRDNRVTSRLFAELLRSMYQDTERGPVFMSSLAYSGKVDGQTKVGNGTLDGRFRKLPAGHWVYGKSGYINSVSTLSGYLVITDPSAPATAGSSAKAKRTIVFSFLFNGFGSNLTNRSLKSVQDRMVELIDEQMGYSR
jgi:D-alanyl-D-alanine carboxypeptidase/D-alanyl-D-alanine-endopeptidase (penicillin-binding protein 4)